MLLYRRATAQPSPDGRAVYGARRLRRAVAQRHSPGDCAVHGAWIAWPRLVWPGQFGQNFRLGWTVWPNI